MTAPPDLGIGGPRLRHNRAADCLALLVVVIASCGNGLAAFREDQKAYFQDPEREDNFEVRGAGDHRRCRLGWI